jgi:hypothetical protein
LTAFLNGTLEQELETLDLNLPPGALAKAIKKSGAATSGSISEKDIFKRIQQLMQQQSQVVVPVVGI